MLTSILALILLYYISKYIVNKIKKIKIGDKNENDENFWMFNYDFKPEKKRFVIVAIVYYLVLLHNLYLYSSELVLKLELL